VKVSVSKNTDFFLKSGHNTRKNIYNISHGSLTEWESSLQLSSLYTRYLFLQNQQT